MKKETKITGKSLIILGMIIIIINIILLTFEENTFSQVMGLISGIAFTLLGVYMIKKEEK